MTFLFAINPVSGGTDKSDWETQIQAFFEKTPHTADLLTLTGENDKETLRTRIGALKPDRLVAVGGDGTVKLVAEAALATDLPMGVLPAGSANGMARELGISPTPAEALAVLTEGKITPIDTILIDDHDLCLHLSDIGLNAQLVKHAQDNNWKGKLGYARAAFRVLVRRRPMRVRIKVDDQVVQRDAFMVVLANARVYGTGATINPDGDLSDGRFEVVVLRQLSFLEFLKMFWRYQPFDPAKTEVFHTTEVSMETKHHVSFQVDGEYRGKIKQLSAVVQPGLLRVLMPPGLPPA
ncbi:MAG: diacylglycerol kinase family lipid kinase [Sphingobacteriaceae bacterium]|nr:diacylglycerol kinase family lipid kinase [Cytophagaceae bacterium]